MSKKESRLKNKLKKAQAFLQLAKLNDADRKMALDEESSDSSEDEHKKAKRKRKRVLVDEEQRSNVAAPAGFRPSSKPLHPQPGEDMPKLTLEERMVKAREEIRARQRAAMERPKLVLHFDQMNTSLPSEACHYVLASTDAEKHPPLFVWDIQQLILYVVQGNVASYKPRWCKLWRWTKVSEVLVVDIDGVSGSDIEEHAECFPFLKSAFNMSMELVSPTQYGSSTAADLFKVPLSVEKMRKRAATEDPNQVKKKLKMEHNAVAVSLPVTDVPSEGATTEPLGYPPPSTNDPDNTPRRLDLLLSPQQLIDEGFPLPIANSQYNNFLYSKDRYKQVTENSPLFAVDCEMCMTTNGQLELTWVSVVDEKLRVIYESFVKPHNPIINYLTRFSGIKKETLENVFTRLSDVQAALKDLLPEDAILCGQSLDGDLRALQLFHPYVIDTSVIYNLTGDRSKKTGLRRLTNTFLGRDIQNHEEAGHNPSEDAIATMELVLLKLQCGVSFGDVILNGPQSFGAPQTAVVKPADDDLPKKAVIGPEESQSTSSGSDDETSQPPKTPSQSVDRRRVFFERPGTSTYESFFPIAAAEKKSVVLVDREWGLVDRPSALTQVVRGDKEAIKVARQQHGHHFMTYVHLHKPGSVLSTTPAPLEDAVKSCLQKLDNRLKKLLSGLSEKAIVVVILGGRTLQHEVHHAMAFAKVT